MKTQMKSQKKVKQNLSTTNIISQPLRKLYNRLSRLPVKEQSTIVKHIINDLEFSELLESNINIFDNLKKNALNQYKEKTLIDI